MYSILLWQGEDYGKSMRHTQTLLWHWLTLLGRNSDAILLCVSLFKMACSSQNHKLLLQISHYVVTNTKLRDTRRLGEERDVQESKPELHFLHSTQNPQASEPSSVTAELSWVFLVLAFFYACVCFVLIFLNCETRLTEGSGLLSCLGGQEKLGCLTVLTGGNVYPPQHSGCLESGTMMPSTHRDHGKDFFFLVKTGKIRDC